MDLFCFFIIFLFCSSGPFIWALMYSFFDPMRSVGSRCIFNAKIKYISVCKMANYVCDGQKIKRSFAVTVCLSVPADSTITLEKDFRKQFYHKQFSFGVKFRIDRSYFHWYFTLNIIQISFFFVIYKHWKVVSSHASFGANSGRNFERRLSTARVENKFVESNSAVLWTKMRRKSRSNKKMNKRIYRRENEDKKCDRNDAGSGLRYITREREMRLRAKRERNGV